MAQCPVLHWLEPCATVGQAAQEPQWLGSLLVFTHSSPQGVGAAAAQCAAQTWLSSPCATQNGFPAMQALHEPQARGVLRGVSHPSSEVLLQSPKPPAHAASITHRSSTQRTKPGST